MRALLALALLSSAVRAPAAADSEELEITEYNTDVEAPFLGAQPLVSADGYHFTAVIVSKTGERLYIDDKKVSEGEPGAFTRAGLGALAGDRTFHAALSRDGKLAAHSFLSRDEQGRAGYRLAVNGAPVGRRYAEIAGVAVSPGGGNVAFVAKTAAGKYAVISAQGEGPSVDAPEDIVGISDTGIVYMLVFNRAWLYRDHKALPYPEYRQVAASPDLSRVAGVQPWTEKSPVEVNGKELGRWKDVRDLRYSPAGDLIFLARTGRDVGDAQVNTVVFNGREAAIPAYSPAAQYAPSARPSDGVSFLVEDSGAYGVLRVGGKPMPEVGEVLPAAEWVGFSPSGRHWAAVVSRDKGVSVVVDGKRFASAPRPLKRARVLFDSETEFHYLGDSLGRIALVCGTIGGALPPRSVCARHGEAMGKKNRYKLSEALEAAPAR